MTERNVGQDRGLVEIKTIGAEKALELRDLGIETAREMGISGFLTVHNFMGMQECAQVVGGKAIPQNVAVALDKIKSVIATRRSTSVQRERMKANNYPREDFANQLGSLFSGGVAIFADEELKEFVGAMAFSGGLPEQDEELCRRVVEKAGLYTDLPKKEEPEDVVTNLVITKEFIDQYNHVNYKAYPQLLEDGQNRLMDIAGTVGFEQIEKDYGLRSVVVAMNVEYKGDLKEGEQVKVHTSITRLGNTSITYNQWVEKEGLRETSLTLVVVLVDSQGKPTKIPDALREKLEPLLKKRS